MIKEILEYYRVQKLDYEEMKKECIKSYIDKNKKHLIHGNKYWVDVHPYAGKGMFRFKYDKTNQL